MGPNQKHPSLTSSGDILLAQVLLVVNAALVLVVVLAAVRIQVQRSKRPFRSSTDHQYGAIPSAPSCV